MTLKLKHKIVTLMVVLSIISLSTQSFAWDTYASRGAWIGGITGFAGGAALGGFVGYGLAGTDNNGEGSVNGNKPAGAVVGSLLFGAIGGGIGLGLGALIGSAFLKHPNVSIAPLLIQSKTQGNTTGGSVEFNF